MADPRQPADAGQGELVGGRWRPFGPEHAAHTVQPAWDANNAAAGRPTTPGVDAASRGWRQAPAPNAPATSSRQQQQPQPPQQRAGTAASHATPPATRGGVGLLRAVRTSSNSLTAMLKRPGTAAAGVGSPGGSSPLFEVRGAAMLPPEPPRPATAGASLSAQQHRPATSGAAQHKQGSPLAFSIQARAGFRAGAASGSSPDRAQHFPQHQHQQPQRPPMAVVASHGLDLGSGSPARTAQSLAQQLEAAAAASQERRQQQQQHAQDARSSASSGATSPLPQGSSASSAFSQHSVYGTYRSSSGGGRGGAAEPSPGGPPRAAPFTTTMHSNPLYSAGSEAYSRPRQQQQQQRVPPPVRTVPIGAAASLLPQTPLAGTAASSPAVTPGVSPLAGTLQAASNLTMVNDSRPISPGPFPSGLASGTLPDGGSARTHSRPVSPQCVDSAPPTPGSFAPLGGLAAAAVRAGSNLSPLKTQVASAAGAQQQRSQSVPASPAPPAAVPAVAPAAPGAAGAAAAAFRLPIFNQDGRLVGYKQNSNLIQRPGACISSAPSSPNRGGLSLGDAFASADVCSPSAAAKPAATPAPAHAPAPPASPTGEFAEALADPFRGFQDADNVVPGYVLGAVLGKGGFCSVRKALHELTGQVVACKIIEKGKLKDPKDRDRVDRECRVMRNLSNHVAIVKLYEYVETRDCVYIMMEAAKRGSLLDYVRDRKKLPESEAVAIFQQLLAALQFCHRKDVVHRDIKLENILIDSAGGMKLIDFGLCGYYVAGKRLRCHCGSPSYAAPEIVARKDYLGPPVDVWSLGIVLFAMLAGYLPFHAKEKKQLSEKILAGVYKPAAWMSPEAQDLISRMLTLDPEQRITLEAAWAHPWVAAAPRWEPPGVGAGRVYRSLTDPTTGSVLPDEAVLAQLELLGADVAAVRRALRSRECNSTTATYHLMFESRQEAQRAVAAKDRAAAGERAAAAAAAAKPKAPPSSAAGDWQWDFATMGAAANTAAAAGAAAATFSSGAGSSAVASHASSGSSSLRSGSSPARVRPGMPAAAPIGSPTRFGQEAAAAGYLGSPRRQAAGAASPLQQAGVARGGAAVEWDIKALRGGEAAGPAHGGYVSREVTPPGAPAPVILATTTVSADCTGGTSPGGAKLSPLPAVLSPKQLAHGAGAGGGSGEHSPPIPQAA